MPMVGYNFQIMKIALSLFAVAALLPAQTLQMTSKLDRKFYSTPDTKGAIAEARAKLESDPKNPELMFKLAQAQISVWQDKEAVETLTRALALSPDNGDYLTERGHRYLPLREFQKARADLKRAVEINPKNMAAYYHLGLAHYFLNEFSEAADAFGLAVKTAPNTDEIINSTNWHYAALRRAGKTAEAKKALEAVPASMTNQSPHTKHYLNLVQFFQGKMTEAEALPPMPPADNTDQEVELPFDTVAYGIGNWYIYSGHPEKAQDLFKRVMKGHVWVTWGFIGSELELAK
jgi:tetratricopeptide (TPR) repeat protein